MYVTSGSSNLKEWNRSFQDYLKWNTRSPAEIVNQKLYFIARRATTETKTATKHEIASELNAQSKNYPGKTVGEILVLKDLQARGKMPKRGSTLAKNMVNYVQRLINKRASHIQFLRSGWLPAIKKLDYWNRKADTNSVTFSKRFAPKQAPGLKQFGVEKGNVKPALPNTVTAATCRGTIANFIGEDDHSGKVQKELRAGLDKAVAIEIRSMRQYMERKYEEEMRRRAARGEFSLV
jgi:hypothetical protein